jgi:hypothetical protein
LVTVIVGVFSLGKSKPLFGVTLGLMVSVGCSGGDENVTSAGFIVCGADMPFVNGQYSLTVVVVVPNDDVCDDGKPWV